MYRQIEGYSAVQVNLFFAFYILGLIPGFLVAGPFSDEHGRKRLVSIALALGIAGSVILGLGGASTIAMCLGRLVSGVSVAVAMVVGTSWIKELSQHDADPPTRARRASLTLTAGFGLGAGVSGALAQWGPTPTLLPYAVQIALSLAAIPPLIRVPETRTADPGPGPIARRRPQTSAPRPPALPRCRPPDGPVGVHRSRPRLRRRPGAGRRTGRVVQRRVRGPRRGRHPGLRRGRAAPGPPHRPPDRRTSGCRRAAVASAGTAVLAVDAQLGPRR